jgi:hypothetical protein
MSTTKKTTSNSTQTGTTNSNVVTTPSNPEWVTQGAQGLAGGIGWLAGQDPHAFVAGPSGLQQQGFDLFDGLGGQGASWLNQAAGMAGGAGGVNTATSQGYNPAMAQAAQAGPASHASAQTAYGGIGNYMNPYEQTVVNSTIGDLDRARQLTLNGNGQGAMSAGQYGGSRQGVLDANANEGFLRSVGSTVGNLRHAGFNSAAGFADSDANRGTSVNLANAGADNSMSALNAQLAQQTALSNQGAANQAGQFGAQAGNTTSMFNAGQGDNAAARQLQGSQVLGGLGQYGLGGMMDAGGVQQGLAQMYAGAPLAVQQQLAGMFGSLPLGLFNGQSQTGTGTSNATMTGTSTQSGGLMDTIGKVAQIGATVAPMFSDERLKVDVRPAGQDGRGRDWYDYRYAWDAPDVTRRGVMAQQILATDPQAVSTHESGFLMVDYSKLEG